MRTPRQLINDFAKDHDIQAINSMIAQDPSIVGSAVMALARHGMSPDRLLEAFPNSAAAAIIGYITSHQLEFAASLVAYYTEHSMLALEQYARNGHVEQAYALAKEYNEYHHLVIPRLAEHLKTFTVGQTLDFWFRLDEACRAQILKDNETSKDKIAIFQNEEFNNKSKRIERCIKKGFSYKESKVLLDYPSLGHFVKVLFGSKKSLYHLHSVPSEIHHQIAIKLIDDRLSQQEMGVLFDKLKACIQQSLGLALCSNLVKLTIFSAQSYNFHNERIGHAEGPQDISSKVTELVTQLYKNHDPSIIGNIKSMLMAPQQSEQALTAPLRSSTSTRNDDENQSLYTSSDVALSPSKG